MAQTSWILTNASGSVYQESLFLSGRQLNHSGMTVRKQRLQGGLRDGVDLVEMDNGTFKLAVVPTRGMGIWKAWCGDLELGWNSPVQGGPVHPQFVNLAEPSGIGWLNGFDEWVVRCGLESNGAPEFDKQGRLKYPLHGKIANIPAGRVEVAFDDETKTLALFGEVREARLFCNSLKLTSGVIMQPGEPGFTLRDEVVNESGHPADLELLYHINVGPPLLEPGGSLVAPLAKLIPRTDEAAGNLDRWNVYEEPQPGTPEHVYFTELQADEQGRTQTLLKNAAGDRGLSLHFNRGQLPYFVLWKSMQMREDGFVTGLEPTLSFPNEHSHEDAQGRVVKLQPGESYQTEIRFECHCDAAGVQQAEESIAALASRGEPEIHKTPPSG